MKEEGFSLIELIVVIGIIAIILSIATISFNSWQVKYNVEKQTKEMLADFTTERIHAMHAKKPIRLTLQPNNYAFKIYSSESEFTNFPGSGIVTMNKSIRYQITKGDGSSITGTIINFDTRGFADNSQTVKITSSNNNAAVDCLNISTAITNMGKMENATCESK